MSNFLTFLNGFRKTNFTDQRLKLKSSSKFKNRPHESSPILHSLKLKAIGLHVLKDIAISRKVGKNRSTICLRPADQHNFLDVLDGVREI